MASLKIFSQSQIIPLKTPLAELPEGAYLKDVNNELNQFVGTWTYTEGSKKYTINFKKLIKEEFNWGPHYYKDMLIGGYKLEVNNQIIYNSILTLYEYYEAPLRGIGFVKNQNKYIITFEDPLNCDISGNVKIEKDPSNINQLIWKMYREFEMNPNFEKCPYLHNIDETSTFGDTMSLPYEMILTKFTDSTQKIE
ncbi:hypothetical protein EB1_34490 [Empedobacter brevis NBRC 14943 = ATCC 43319]|uniref:DUF6705 domain-containing protein n=1 Tax=Empedobacter brevis NBRC 14943 = ATCC 43319 TaxID=1218108 RepID=A0A511NLI3_9FLAO|nr:hypothetical protein EB1_34490 [Empedobacter brevis NBRC 14943 = ATCC 43319]